MLFAFIQGVGTNGRPKGVKKNDFFFFCLKETKVK